MKCPVKILLLCTLCLLFQIVQAQNLPGSAERASRKAYESATKYLQQKDYLQAIAELRQTVQHNPSFIKAHQQLADCLRMTGAYEEAGKSYRAVLNLNPSYSPLTIYGLAISDFYCGLYESALPAFKKYAESTSLSASSRALVEKHIQDCIFSIQAVQHPVAFVPSNLGNGINTSDQEYFPVVTADDRRLIFTRRTEKNEDLYESEQESASWAASAELSKSINTPGYNEGAQSISPDGMYLFYSGCNKPDGHGSCDIYISRRTGNTWSAPYNPGAPINTGAWESQPAISANGKRLYFVSDRKGGYGANDIWYADLQPDGKWSEPLNAGPNINTAYDEHSPFIYPDNKTLYFSSNGWPGLGKQDLFMSRLQDDGNWQKPQNLGYPVNTSEEQSGLMVSTDGLTAYYASDRPDGYGGMDIYSFKLSAEHRPGSVTVIQSVVQDAETGKKLDGKISLEAFGSGQLLYEQDPDAGPDLLAVVPGRGRYTMRVLKEGYMPYSENINGAETAAAAFLKKPVSLRKVQAKEQGVLNNIFFDTDQYTLLPESKTELQFLIHFLEKNPGVRIEIGGHTDNAGTDEWNLALSDKRAREVYKYLISNGVSRVRLSYKGYGRSNPIAGNDSEQGKQANRRTSFTIQP